VRTRGDAPVPEEEPNLPQVGYQHGDGPAIMTCYVESLDLGGQDRVNAEVNFQERKREKQKVRVGFKP
jgi:hypothetical protein